MAGAWTLPKGKLWGKATTFIQTTDEEFLAPGRLRSLPIGDKIVNFSPGDKTPFPFNGESELKAVFFEVFYGVTDAFDVGIQIPFFDQSFTDDAFAEERSESGFSDLRFIGKYRYLSKPVVASLQFGIKAPTAEFKIDQTKEGITSVGEGQWDFDITASFGSSFWPFPAYVNAEIGYKLRLENSQKVEILGGRTTSADRDPGDEILFSGEFGYSRLNKVTVGAKLEGIHGDPATIIGQEVESDVKRITYLSPTLTLGPFMGVTLESAVRFGLKGKNYPAGEQFVTGLSYSYDLF